LFPRSNAHILIA